MSMSIKLDTRRLRQLDGQAQQRAEDLLDLTAEGIANATRNNITTKKIVDTGALLNSIHVERGPFRRTIADGVLYGVFNELGARGRPGRPFFYPAFEMFRQPFLTSWKKLAE